MKHAGVIIPGLIIYFLVGLGAAIGSYDKRPSMGASAIGLIALWPAGVGVIIGRTATLPDNADAE